MHRYWILGLAAATLHAAAIVRGTVVENQTGHSLARALVVLQPVTGTSGATLSARTNQFGVFEFPPLPGGMYVVSASRRSFAPIQYGQKRWKSSGVPVVVEDNGSTFLNIRLPRLGGITGQVLDENDVGLPELEVIAYRNTRPPKPMARATTDDRGVFRVFGLEPGTYIVRTAPKQYDDGGYVPTFAVETNSAEQARIVEVALDQDTPDVRVRPASGKLVNLSGQIFSPRGAATVTLASDMGRQSVQTAGNFEFRALAPGAYELLAETPPDARGSSVFAAWTTLQLDRDRTDLRLNLSALGRTDFSFVELKGQIIDPTRVQVQARRKDLAGEGDPMSLRLNNGSAALGPGRWELSLVPMPGYSVVDFSGPRGERSGRADGWNEVTIGNYTPVRFVLSSSPGSIHGTVKANTDAVPGAPVFLEAYDPENRRRITDLRTVRTDSHGQYRFYGLTPGFYRVLSTFEFQSPDSIEITYANAPVVKVDDGQDQVRDLDVYIIR